MLAGVASGLMRDGEPAEIDRAIRAALATAEQVGDVAQQVSTAVTFGKVCSSRLEPEAGLVQMRQALADAERIGDRNGFARAQLNISNVLYELGRYVESAEAAPVVGGEARRLGVGHSIGIYRIGNHAEALVALGRWDEAAALLDEVMRLDPPGNVALIGLVQQAELALARGAANANELVERASAYLSRPYLEAQLRLPLVRLRIAALLAGGETDGAGEAAVSTLDDADIAKEPRYGWPVLAAVADALTATGDPRLRAGLHTAVAGTAVRYPAERAYAADVAAALLGSPAPGSVAEPRRAAGRPGRRRRGLAR